jgi:hypothetical protein
MFDTALEISRLMTITVELEVTIDSLKSPCNYRRRNVRFHCPTEAFHNGGTNDE